MYTNKLIISNICFNLTNNLFCDHGGMNKVQLIQLSNESR